MNEEEIEEAYLQGFDDGVLSVVPDVYALAKFIRLETDYFVDASALSLAEAICNRIKESGR